jgi:hypothetical protein
MGQPSRVFVVARGRVTPDNPSRQQHRCIAVLHPWRGTGIGHCKLFNLFNRLFSQTQVLLVMYYQFKEEPRNYTETDDSNESPTNMADSIDEVPTNTSRTSTRA